jgi:nicotinate-nucleotide pyrophosphorylase (carboxylating)
LEKYAVRCGGGCNHRTGLFDAVLIKDNHLALSGLTPEAAVRQVREFLRQTLPDGEADRLIIEVEVDTLDQLESVLPVVPDLVLLDNMSVDQLRQAVARRDAAGAQVQLEASGGVNLDTVPAIAATGVDRISVGALTHSALSLDIGLDWQGS